MSAIRPGLVQECWFRFCDRSLDETCYCYWLRTQRRGQRALPPLEDEYDAFGQERANVGKAYDDAVGEEERLGFLCLEARVRRIKFGRRFEQWLMPASTKLLHTVISVTELRGAVLSPLLPGEVSALYTGYELPVDKRQIAANLSPLKLILSGGKRLQSMAMDGYNLTIISGTKDLLLYGFSSLASYSEFLSRRKSRQWSAVLIATKDRRSVPCTTASLPLSECGCPGTVADSVDDHFDDNGTSRTVNLSYGLDVVSIWMPLCEHQRDTPVGVPQSIFQGFAERVHNGDWTCAFKISYSHLTEIDSQVRGPLEPTRNACRKRVKDSFEAPLFAIEVCLKDRPFDPGRVISYEIGHALR